MSDSQQLAAAGRAIVDEARYLTLATADAAGRPWASPVWFAHEGYRTFVWVSHPDVTHSRNIAVRPEVSLVVFDSAPVGEGQALYGAARAEAVPDGELEAALAVFAARSQAQGSTRPWTPDTVRAPAALRLYRAVVSEHSMLDPSTARGQGDHRVAVSL